MRTQPARKRQRKESMMNSNNATTQEVTGEHIITHETLCAIINPLQDLPDNDEADDDLLWINERVGISQYYCLNPTFKQRIPYLENDHGMTMHGFPDGALCYVRFTSFDSIPVTGACYKEEIEARLVNDQWYIRYSGPVGRRGAYWRVFKRGMAWHNEEAAVTDSDEQPHDAICNFVLYQKRQGKAATKWTIWEEFHESYTLETMIRVTDELVKSGRIRCNVHNRMAFYSISWPSTQ